MIKKLQKTRIHCFSVTVSYEIINLVFLIYFKISLYLKKKIKPIDTILFG